MIMQQNMQVDSLQIMTAKKLILLQKSLMTVKFIR
jgi:hypothetical protein